MMRMGCQWSLVFAVWGFSLPAKAADTAEGAPELGSRELAQQTLASTPSGVDTYTAFLGERGLGASGVANAVTDTASGTDLSGGLRLWGGFLQRVTVQGDAAKDSKGRFAPSAAVGVRVLGDRASGWALGVLGRYRTEGFKSIDGEVEGGLLGSFARRQLHLDANMIAGVGVEESEADVEGLLRFVELGCFERLTGEDGHAESSSGSIVGDCPGLDLMRWYGRSIRWCGRREHARGSE